MFRLTRSLTLYVHCPASKLSYLNEDSDEEMC